tara:strand:- start:1110 stop:1811 length:702 start_codon:yes stop_codon:yes gene_type:complete
MSMMVDFQSMAGPGDRSLPMSEISGYQPVSRIGEIVMNCFVDAYEFTSDSVNDQLKLKEIDPLATGPDGDTVVEFKPHFHEWASVREGMICLARRKRTAVFRQYVAAETAVPVIACAAGLKTESEKDFFFAGVARTKSVRSPDDGIGPSVDEFFTLSIGGMVTVLNTSGQPIHPGDQIEWCLWSQSGTHSGKRPKQGPRRVGIKIASVSSAKIIGRALTFAKSGESLDILLKQ